MLSSEFYDRTGYIPTSEEWDEITKNYMHSNLDKDDFCKAWKKVNSIKVENAENERKAKEALEKMHEYVINKVVRFVNGEESFTDRYNKEQMTKNLQKVLGRYYDGELNREARRYVCDIMNFAGITQGFRNWENYWHLHSAVCYGI